MDDRSNSGWESNTAYLTSQIEGTVKACGIEIYGETPKYFTAYCPFHGNRVTPSFTVSRDTGTYFCFNASCGARGSLIELVKKTKGLNEFAARRLVIQNKNGSASIGGALRKRLAKKDFAEFPQETLDRMHQQLWHDDAAIDYMYGRGFTRETLEYFQVGYSSKKNLITVPMHDINGKPVGVIGRSIKDKRFHNSKGLPSPHTLFNIHRAREHGDTVIIVEASIDDMLMHQSGFPNTVGCLMGYFSDAHMDQIDKNFNNVIIMTDFDDYKKYIYVNCNKCKHLCTGHNPGRDLGMKISQSLPRKKVEWAAYSDKEVFPGAAKDPGDMTHNQRVQCIENRMSDLRYRQWLPY